MACGFRGTPFRPILPNSHVILMDRQGNPDSDNQLGSEWFPPGFTPNTCTDNSGKSMSTNCIEMDARSPNAISRDNDSACREYSVHNAALRYHPPFSSLLALADAVLIAPMAATMRWDKDFSFPPNPWSNICAPDNTWRTSDALSSSSTSHFAPVTPEKSAGTESRWVKDVQYMCTNVGMNGHSNKQENANNDTGLAAKELERSKEMQLHASNLLDVSSFPKEDQCNENGAIQNAELKKTPPQKPGRKKHRPKVITEGKPRTQKTTILNDDSPKESPKTKRKYVRKNALNTTPTSPPQAIKEFSDHKVSGETKAASTGKRKYVRRKPLNKNSTATPGEATIGSSDPKINGTAAFERSPPDRSMSQKVQKKVSTTTLLVEATTGFMDQKMFEAAREPCRRALNFNIKGQWEDESSRCKLMVNVDSQPRTQDHRKGDGADSTMHLGCGVEVIVRNSRNGAAYDINSFVDEILKDYVSERQALSKSIPAKTTACQDNWVTRIPESHIKGIYQSAPNLQGNASLMMSKVGAQLSQMSPDYSNSSIITTLNDGEAGGLKRRDSGSFGRVDNHGTNITGIHYNDLLAYQNLVPFPQPYKKKRTEKGQSTSTTFSLAKEESIGLQVAFQDNSEGSISTDNPCNSSLNSFTNGHPNTKEKGRAFQPKLLASGYVLSNSKRPKQKRLRNRGAWNLASPTQFVPPSYPMGGILVDCGIRQLENFPSPNTSIEAPVAGMHATLKTKKRTKKRANVVQLATTIGNEEKSQGKLVIYNQNQFSANAFGAPEFMWKQMFAVDEIANQMKNLNINRESSERHDNKCSALVPYTIRNLQGELVLYTDGIIVPYDGSFEHIKKRRPRPKVELDEETNRVWKLLMESINNEGIDGTDEDKAKWWEEERNIFYGRTNSFIARMHLVQGDRRFSPWKGSIVDSVVGVFLTQNVSDHLSSSAFMSLAARFPLKSNRYQPTLEVATTSETDEPIKCIPNPEISRECNKEIPSESNCESCMTLQITEIEEREVANSDESLGSNTSGFISGTNVDACYELMLSRSTPNNSEMAKHDFIAGHRRDAINTYPSQDSLDSTISHPCKRKKSFSQSNPATSLTDGCEHNQPRSYSFVELLRMASSTTKHDVYNQGNGNVVSTQNLKYQYHTTENVENSLQTQKLDNLDALKSSLGACVTPYSDGLAHPSDIGVLKADNFQMIYEKTGQIEASKNLGQNSVDYCNLAAESARQMTDTNRPTICNDEAQNCPFAIAQSHDAVQENESLGVWHERRLNIYAKPAGTSSSQAQKDELQPEISGALDIVETSVSEILDKSTPKSTLSYLTGNHPSESKELKMNEAKRKAKSRRVGDEIQANFDWDILRKQAEASGSKRERSASTVDSLDWEAVRSANVEEIADAIKERGMNNILAGRIKDFLDRLVSEHGSIDLEWLRDVPPDKAKEYLLSIRGLGLKSVECVRLLTLHHLAFPVDTNVGRIAVRLGWVPLQPLPESLQLHLLELYPVLESIQKYLWPRLCKLDQRTLYELHYQMITFGKVFCTKSKPNCNACPMRGECRHFASAFASARLALPGPEQKSMVCATEKRIADENPVAVVTERLLLPQPNASKNLEENELSHANCPAKAGVSNSVPIVEEPSTPEPQCTQTLENDIEDIFYEDPDEIPTIKLNIQEFTQNLQNYMQENMELQGDMSKALVALTAEAASIPMPKLKNVSRLRTEHQVYELPDSHPLVQGLDRREPDDPCSYLLAIWTPGEMADSIEPPEKSCSSQQNRQLCDDKTCFSCNSVREVNSQIVRGTLLIPCRTAMRGSFPLNGTYFQVNEVFADHDSSLNPIHVPREWVWNLPRRTVYFGTSIPTIFKGLPTEGIQHCFWRGYVCVRGFDQKTRAPRPLMARLHFPASKLKARNTDDT